MTRANKKPQWNWFCRCLIDGGFAHIKKLYRKSDADCLEQMFDLVNQSAPSNIAEAFELPNGEQRWKSADWKGFLRARFKQLKNIQKYCLFRFTKEEPGCVLRRRRWSRAEDQYPKECAS